MRVLITASLLMAISLSARATVSKLSCDALRQAELTKDRGVTLVDVRNPTDFAAGHIENARNVPLELLGAVEFSTSSKIVVYCGEDSCPLSNAAANLLSSRGYGNVYVLDGGFGEWLKRRYPAQKGSQTATSPEVAQMDARTARARAGQGGLVILDVRSALEFRSGHLPGARNVPLEDLANATSGLDKRQDTLVYDRLSVRSRRAATGLASAGFKVMELSGGISAWVRDSFPLEVK